MEIKAELTQYTEADRMKFIVEYNHKQGFEIKEYTTSETKQEEIINPETDEVEVVEYQTIIKHLEAWGYTQEELLEQEKERIAQLNMTRGDFIEGLILAQGKDEKDIIALIEALPINEIEKKVYINRVKNALDFYRGYPVIDVLCGFLNVPLENMDKFFETKDYNYLLPVVNDDPSVTHGEDEVVDGK